MNKLLATSTPPLSFLEGRALYISTPILEKSQGSKMNGVGSEACFGAGELAVALLNHR